MNKRERVLRSLEGKPVDRAPLGFWLHFLKDPRNSFCVENEEAFQENLSGHDAYFANYPGDIYKIMTDGFFHHPGFKGQRIAHLKDLKDLEPISKEHPWIRKQVRLAKYLVEKYGKDKALFYNIFSPIQTFRIDNLFSYSEKEVNQHLAEIIAESPEEFKRIMEIYTKDLITLTKSILAEARVDGIYFSVNNISNPSITKEIYDKYIKPFELQVLEEANKYSPYNLLHICGFHGNRNDITWYKDYPVAGINWAVKVEGVPLEKGREVFPNKVLIGGFGQTPEDIIYTGSKEEIQQEVKRILDAAGTDGIALGADCTIPPDTPLEHIAWIKEAVEQYQSVRAGEQIVEN